MNKIYIAGGWEERLTIVRPYIQRILKTGLAVTFDWTQEDEAGKDADGGDSAGSSQARRRAAILDSQAIEHADVLWFITPGYRGSSGSWWELGYATALKKHVFVSGPHHKRSIFTELAEQCFDTHEAAFEYLSNIAKKLENSLP